MISGQIRIGLTATLVGPFAGMGEDGIRGAELAVAESEYRAAGQRIYLFQESTNAIAESAVQAADTLFNDASVDFVIGPLSGNEGMALRDYAHAHPDRAFINGAAGGQDMTLRNPAPNFFSFSTNGVQWMTGLGTYAYEQGFRRMVTIAEAYSYPFGQIGGLMLEFCRAGGRIIDKFWVALGTTDFRSVIAALPDNADAIFVALSGEDARNFLAQYYASGRRMPLIGGTTVIDQTVLDAGGDLGQHITGMISASPIADDIPAPEWQTFVNAYRRQFPQGLSVPSLFAYCYYVNTKAALLALAQVNGDLSNGQARFMEALHNLKFIAPTGPVRLDHNRNAIATNFIRRVTRRADGTLYHQPVKIIPEVGQTLGVPETEYLRIGPFDQNNPACP